MATFYASHAQALKTAKESGSRAGTLRGQDALGDLLVVTSTYTVDSTETAADTIEITAGIPEGCVLVPSLSHVVVTDDPGTALTLVLENEDGDALSGTIDLSSVGKVEVGTTIVTGLPSSTKILANLATATTLTADASITFIFVFRAVS